MMGFARIVQGSHFASDVLWSAGAVYFTGLTLAFVYYRLPGRSRGSTARRGSKLDLVKIEREQRGEQSDQSETGSIDYPQAA
jgi:hypothetical protein